MSSEEKGMGGIRLVLKLDFPVLIGEEQHLTRRVHPATVEFVRIEDLFRTQVAQAAAAPKQRRLERSATKRLKFLIHAY